jgi:hypothetical protein
MIAIRFTRNIYFAQFALQPGRLIVGRYMVLWGRRAFNQF